MKKHHNGAAAPGEASLGSQKMSLAPWAVLPFLTLSPAGAEEVATRVVGVTGVVEGLWKGCGGVVLGWTGNLGWAGCRRELCPPPGLLLGVSKGLARSERSQPCPPSSAALRIYLLCKHSHSSFPLSALFCQSRALRTKISAINSGHFGKQWW